MHGPTLALGLTTLAVLLVGSRLLPRAPMALLGMLGAAAAVAILDLGAARGGRGRPHPRRTAGPLRAEASPLTVSSPCSPRRWASPFVAYTDNVLTGRAFASRRHEGIDPRRELLALGAANVGAGLMHGFPVSSSGSRTAIGDAVGGRTQLTSLVTAVTTVLALLLACARSWRRSRRRPWVRWWCTPPSDWSTVAEFHRLARFRRSELLLAVATTVAVLLVGVLLGVLVAVGLSLLDLLRRVVRPNAAVEGFVPDMAGMHDVDDYPQASVVPGLLVYRYDSPLFFANAENFRPGPVPRSPGPRPRSRGSCSTPRRSSRSTSPPQTPWSHCARS